ncbi:MAG TPA: hypothetical protein PLU11_07010 [Chitinophagaceae bacterium]|nr:hypothetical protein [Chitinophagaceae bacterium]HPH32259.1 hypothetical protein [Chitinophagaceae bacterium]HPN58904.1 hypothetical protein [Chitinophagaceae bacterium]
MQFFKPGLLAFTLSCTTFIMAQPITLSVKSGQKYKVENTTKMNTSAEAMGQTMETIMNSNNTTVYEIKNVSAAALELSATITTIVVNGSTMGQEMSFDSEKKDNSGPMADVLTPILNKSKSYTMDNKGTIVKQDETEEAEGQAAMMGISNVNYTNTDLFLPALVGKSLKPGDSFDDTGSLKKEKYSTRDSGTYKVTSIENGIASIVYTGIQTIIAIGEQMGMEVTTNSNNIVKSEYQVDVNTGIVLSKATVIESSVSVDIAGMTIPATGKTIVTVKVTAF